MNNQHDAKLNLCLARDRIHSFFTLFRQGFMVEIQAGCSIKKMLADTLGLDGSFVEDRIKTIFLDSKPVDDISTACITNGSVLALSGAMPGLAGATLRRGGQLASFRGSISCRSRGENNAGQGGYAIVKLFNLLVNDLGPIFLKNGILIKKQPLVTFLRRQPEDFWLILKSAHWNGKKIGADTILDIEYPDMMLLAVEALS
jgi:hypothetical protein